MFFNCAYKNFNDTKGEKQMSNSSTKCEVCNSMCFGYDLPRVGFICRRCKREMEVLKNDKILNLEIENFQLRQMLKNRIINQKVMDNE